MSELKLPDAPNSIQKGIPLKYVLDKAAVQQLAINLNIAGASIDSKSFEQDAMKDIEELGIKERAERIATVMRKHLPQNYSEAISLIQHSLTPPMSKTVDNGLAPMFYMPHCSYVAAYGINPEFNGGEDPFDLSMQIQYELTKRFSCEFSIRSFLMIDQERTLSYLYQWQNDDDPHVRRLCTEGTRPRLPWAAKLTTLANDPSPVIPILEILKNDPDLYVRRSVANHIGDIAKDHMDLALDLCEKWLDDASKELKWVIRHALRNPYKKGVPRAIDIRLAAK